jgi:hypothetical protein
MLLAGLSAWTYFGQPEDQIVNLIGYIDERIDVGLAGQSDEIIEVSATEPDRIVLADNIVAVDQPADAAPEPRIAAAQRAQETQLAEPGSTAMIEESVTAMEQSTNQSAPAAATADDHTTDTADEEAVSAEDEFKADTNTDQIPTEPEAVVAESVVSVSEGAGAVRITTLRSDKFDTPLIWWTSEHTADADKDYISITQKTVTDRTFNEGGVLHIPLVDDSLSEPRESFFVNIGRLNPQQGQIERIAAVRVDIIDDDLP